MAAISAFARRFAPIALAALLLAPAALDAQIFRVGRRSQDPLLVGSLGVGLFQSQSVVDGTTQSEWRIGDGAQYRGSLEYALRGGSTVGAVATYARLPFRFSGGCVVDVPSGGDIVTGPCGDYDARMTVTSLWGTYHGGGSGAGLHGVLDAGLGYTWYGDFEADNDSGILDDVETDKDFSFFFGTGFGYGITRRLSVDLVQDFIFVRHQGEGLSGDDRTTTQQRTTRLTVRYGFGNRRPGV